VAKKGGVRTPMGWKLLGGKAYCQKCKKLKYFLRAVTIPIAGPVNGDWPALRKVLTQAWSDTTRLCNWLMTTYYVRDRQRAPEDEKLGTWDVPYLYPEARVLFPNVEPQTLVSAINTVSKKYKASRFDLIWRNAISLPNFRYPTPVPINTQAFKLFHDKERWVFSFRWLGEWHELYVRQGHEFRRQLKALEQLATDEAEVGEAALYEVSANVGDHRNGVKRKRLMLKIAGWFPRPDVKAEGVLVARTVEDSFLIALHGDAEVWRLNADHVRRWIAQDMARRHRLSEDLKAERRFPKAMRQGVIDRMGQNARSQRHRINSWMHESSTQLVNFALRRKCGTLTWDDSVQGFLPSFPWAQYRGMIEQKCAAAGVKYVYASAVVTPEAAGPLEGAEGDSE
jgi:hypothetical protein